MTCGVGHLDEGTCQVHPGWVWSEGCHRLDADVTVVGGGLAEGPTALLRGYDLEGPRRDVLLLMKPTLGTFGLVTLVCESVTA